MNIKKLGFIKLTAMYFRRITKHDIPGLSAEMSFYLLTALFPFVILLFFISTLISSGMQETLFSIISYLPRDMEILIKEMLMTFSGSLPIIIIASVLGIWYISNVINTITKAVNRFYGAKESRGFFKLRFLSIMYALSVIIIVFISFALVIFGEWTQMLLEKVPFLDFIDTEQTWSYLRYFSFLAVIFVCITLMFWHLPDKKLRFRDVIGGSALTTIAWCIASYGFAFYVNSFSKYHVIYGSLASIIILVTWTYLSSFVILLGASLNAFFYRIRPVKRYYQETSNQK